jgi:predicted esterase
MYTTNQVLEREIDAGLVALRARWGDFIDDGAMLYAGFSQGAIMGVAIMTRHPSRYPRAVLVEGGAGRWTRDALATFARGGGERVLFGCGQAGCRAEATQASSAFEHAGLSARVVYAKGLGHRYDDAVAVEVASSFGWVVEGDARW